jgi:hypothetical protein
MVIVFNRPSEPSVAAIKEGKHFHTKFILLFFYLIDFFFLFQGTSMGAGAPNRPLPPTPDEDANERTLMKRVRPFVEQNLLISFLLSFPLFPFFDYLFYHFLPNDDPSMTL